MPTKKQSQFPPFEIAPLEIHPLKMSLFQISPLKLAPLEIPLFVFSRFLPLSFLSAFRDLYLSQYRFNEVEHLITTEQNKSITHRGTISHLQTKLSVYKFELRMVMGHCFGMEKTLHESRDIIYDCLRQHITLSRKFHILIYEVSGGKLLVEYINISLPSL